MQSNGMKKSSTDHHPAARGPGYVQEGFLRAEKILKDKINNLEQSATNDFESMLRAALKNERLITRLIPLSNLTPNRYLHGVIPYTIVKGQIRHERRIFLFKIMGALHITVSRTRPLYNHHQPTCLIVYKKIRLQICDQNMRRNNSTMRCLETREIRKKLESSLQTIFNS